MGTELLQMQFNESDINEKAFYILKKTDEGKFISGYLKIDDDLKVEIDLIGIIDMINNHNIDIKTKIDIANKFIDKLFLEYNFLFSHRSYCSKYALRSFNCEFKSVYDRADIKIRKDSTSINDIDLYHKSDNHSYGFLSWMSDFLNSYLIERGYEKFKLDQNNLIFSHRIVGWNEFEYKLNDKLSVNISTNFSYGSSSYFFVTLKYGTIQIIPYSRLVLYRFVNVKQFIRHTREYNCYDSSWKHAIDFVRDASNDYEENGDQRFIANYIVGECEKLISILPEYLRTNEFRLSETLDGTYFGSEVQFQTIKLEGYDLNVFRGEKMSGALSFIDSLRELEQIINSKVYVECIEKCAVEVLPELSLAISSIPIDVDFAINQISINRSKLERLTEKNIVNTEKEQIYAKTKALIKHLFSSADSNTKNSDNLENKFKEYFPEYEDFKIGSQETKSEINKMITEIESWKRKHIELQDNLLKISNYKQIIENYFNMTNGS